jgi:intracellular multiplication protein IcmW
VPDLSHQTVHQFWKDYPDPMIYRVISFMESVEDWTIDDKPSVEAALNELADELEKIGEIEIGAEEDLITLCASIRTGRCLRLLMCLDTAHPGAASKVLMHAEENTKSDNDIAGIFLRRNIVFERLRLLGRVFSQERFELVANALEESSYD